MRAKRALQIMLAFNLMAGPASAQEPTPDLAWPRSHVDSMVARFYERRGGRLAWSDFGVVSPQARVLLRALARAGDDGLDREDYPAAALDPLLRGGAPSDSLWQFDSLLTVTFFEYASDVSRGRLSPAAVDSLWTAAPRATDLVRLLESGLASGRLAAVLRTLPPPQPGYAALRRTLARYQAIAVRGGWPTVPAGPPIEPGMVGHRVAELRRRLAAEGYAAPAETDADRFDDGLEAQVKEFQEGHGLTADGIVGAATLRALNVSAATRLQAIRLNFERWRWLPRYLGDRYIVVNSAAFTLEIVDGGHPVVSMRAIVGRPDWPTPIASSRVTDAIFRPVWYVPRAIAARELLPLVQRDPGYVAREGMRVLSDSAAGGRELNPTAIDWTAVTENTFTYSSRRSRADQSARRGEVRVLDPVQRVHPRHPRAPPVQRASPRIQPRLRARRASGRSRRLSLVRLVGGFDCGRQEGWAGTASADPLGHPGTSGLLHRLERRRRPRPVSG